MESLFWLSLALAVYTYIGYPALLALIAPVIERLRQRALPDEKLTPSVSLVISLHNEEKLITKRIENFEALKYPAESIELVLGDDCSIDRTRELIRERAARNPRIRLETFDTHQGKTEVLNQLVPRCKGEIIVFSDGNTFFEALAVQKLVRHFSDPRVGVVCGRLVLQDPSGRNVEQSYWQFESGIKELEGELGVVLGANGGIYALRKDLFRPLQSNVVQADDFIWPVLAHQYGFFGVYEREAIAHEEASPSVEAELSRKVRIGTGNYRALRECWPLLLPQSGWMAFAFWSHKVLRWFTPLLLIVMLITNAFLLDRLGYRVFFILQLAFYLCAFLGKLLSQQRNLVAKILRLPYYFVGSNLALAVGFYRCVSGRQQAAWSQKAHRAG